ncbi:hypothetical protein D3C86_1586340 [compost metagenome]
MIVALVVVAGVGGYFFIRSQDKKELASSSQEAKKEVTALNLQGDSGIQERYVDFINANKKDDAQKLFDNAVKTESDVDKKIELLRLNVLLALSYKRIDEAEAAALKMLDIKESVDSYESIIRVYAVKNDLAKQKEYNSKARAFVEKSNLENKDTLLESYDMKLSNISAREAQE